MAYPKPSFPDMVPQLDIKGTKHRIAEKLTPLQYIIGGAIGGAIGAAAAVFNYNIFRQTGTPASKWGKVIGVIIGAYLLFFVFVLFISKLLHR